MFMKICAFSVCARVYVCVCVVKGANQGLFRVDEFKWLSNGM